mgnify:CR=1 FL=1
MKGATADPSVNTKRAPNNARKIMIGASHHFLRTMRKSQNSKNTESAIRKVPVHPQLIDLGFISPLLHKTHIYQQTLL